MTIIEKLKSESVRMRKERNPMAAFSVFMISEIEKVGKNDGNRETKPDEVIQFLKKQITTTKYNLSLPLNEDRAETMKMELAFLEELLPTMVSDQEVREFLTEMFGDAVPKNKGEAIKYLRDEFGALVDMRTAVAIVSEMYGI
jgi:uncharacterized protein YqeY